MTIVGVVGHIRHDRLDEDVRPQIYFNYTQRTQDRMALAVRTQGDPAAMGASLAGAIRGLDPEQPVYDARTLEAVVDRSLAQRWLQTSLLGAFAAIALVLASIGVYGVIAYTVGQRRREFGIRLALGARRSEIVLVVMRRGAVLFAPAPRLGSRRPRRARASSAACCSTSRRSISSASASRPRSSWPSRSPRAASLPAARPASIRPSLFE